MAERLVHLGARRYCHGGAAPRLSSTRRTTSAPMQRGDSLRRWTGCRPRHPARSNMRTPPTALPRWCSCLRRSYGAHTWLQARGGELRSRALAGRPSRSSRSRGSAACSRLCAAERGSERRRFVGHFRSPVGRAIEAGSRIGDGASDHAHQVWSKKSPATIAPDSRSTRAPDAQADHTAGHRRRLRDPGRVRWRRAHHAVSR